MTYTLAIADRTYSSWSLRGWLLFEKFGLDVTVRTARMYQPDFPAMLADFGAAKLVPAMLVDDVPIWDTLAMAETLAERHPDKGFWPKDPSARALARSLTAEMHSGFNALREACTMNLRHSYKGFEPSEAVLADIKRIELLWRLAQNSGHNGPWLFGDYSIADVFYAPVATRIATYGLPVNNSTQAYVDSHLADPSFRRWRAMGLAQSYVQPGYDLDLPTKSWPGPTPVAAHTVEGGQPINENCPYSGKPVSADSLAEIDGRIIGFCNQFCRDKSVADAAAWPKLAHLLG